MSTKREITIHDVRGTELPEAWAKQAGIADDERVDVTIIRVQRKRRKPTIEEIMPSDSNKILPVMTEQFEQKQLLELFDKLDWDIDYDYKTDRSRQ